MRTRSYLAQTASLTLHGLGLLALLLLMNRAAAGVDPTARPLDTKHLVYVASPGMGGGGGGYKAPAPRVELKIPVARPATIVPVATVPLDPMPSITAPVVTNAASILTASGFDGKVTVPFGGGGDGKGIGTGKGDGVGDGDGTGFGGEQAGEGGVSWPQRVREVKPQYTAGAMQRKIQGAVLVQAVIGLDGRIISARVVRSLDAIYGLDQAALDAVRATLMTPCKKAGKPVVCVVPFELQFTLR